MPFWAADIDPDGDGDADTGDTNAFIAVLFDMPLDPAHEKRADVDGSGVADAVDIPPFVAAFIP